MLDGSARGRTALVEGARTRTAVYYDTDRADVPVLCVCLPSAVRLPNALVSSSLPSGPVAVERGGWVAGDATWALRRWWAPPRPRGLVAPARPSLPGVTVPVEIRPDL